MTETCGTEQIRGDDVFANSSNETVVENVDYSLVLKEAGDFLNMQNTADVCTNSFPIASTSQVETGKVKIERQNSVVNRSLFPDSLGPVDLSFTVNQLIAHSSNLPRRLFCPFCTQHYGFEFLLKEHIKNIHTLEIETLVINGKNFQFHSCPFCQAKFYIKGLLMKHIIYRHQECALNALREASPSQYVNCRFCPFRVWKKHEKQLLIHVETKHLKNFEAVFTTRYSNISDFENGIDTSTSGTGKEISSSPILSTSPNILHVDVCFEKQHVKSSVQKSILKNRRTCEDDYSVESDIDTSYFKARNGGVKRRLYYEVCSDEVRDNNICATKSAPAGHTHKRSRWKAIFKKMRPQSIPKQPFFTSTPYTNSARNMNFVIHDLKSELHHVCASATSPTKRVKFSMVDTEADAESDEILRKEHGMLSNYTLKAQPVVNQGTDVELVLKQFKCALCLQAFMCNNELLNHTRHKHSGPFNLLWPRYRCGECEAKFYKNSYLLRHCKFHHTPLCLRNRKHS